MSYSRGQLLSGLKKASEAKDYDSANEIAEMLDSMETQDPAKQERSFKESAGNIAGDIATEAGISLAGQGIGSMMGPGYFAVAPAAGAYGNYKSQQRQIERGDRAKYAPGEILSAALINLLPGATLGKVAAPIAKAVAGSGGRLAQIGGAATANAVIGGGIGATAKTIEKAVDDNRVPTFEEYAQSILGGAALGSIIGGGVEASRGLSKASSEVWSKIKGKKVNELSPFEQDDPAIVKLLNELKEKSRPSSQREQAEMFFRKEQKDILNDAINTDLENRVSLRKKQEDILNDALNDESKKRGTGIRDRLPDIIKPAKDSAEAFREGGKLSLPPREEYRPSTRQEQEAILRDAPYTQTEIDSPSLIKPAKDSAEAFREGGMLSLPSREEYRPSTRQEQEAILRDAPLVYTREEIEKGLRPVPVKPAKSSAEVLEDLKRKEILAFEQKVRSEDVANRLRSQDFQKARLEEQKQIVEEARQIIEKNRLGTQESTGFTGSPKQTQLSRLDTERGNALRERARINEKLGRGPEQSLPTQEEVINEAVNYRGIGSPSRAREMGLGALAVGGLGLAGASNAEAATTTSMNGKFSTETQIAEDIGDGSKVPVGAKVTYKGETFYFPYGTTREQVEKKFQERHLQEDTNEKLAGHISAFVNFDKIKFSNQSLLRQEENKNAPSLVNQIPPALINALSMAGGPFTKATGGFTADALHQYLNNSGKGLNVPSAVKGGLMNLIPVKSGQTARNAALVGAGSAAGEVFEKAMDGSMASPGDVLRAGASGVAGIGVQGMADRGRLAAKQFQNRTTQGANDLVTSANDLNLAIDPTLFKQKALGRIVVEASGGQDAFRHYLTAKNQGQLREHAAEIAGFPGQDLSTNNFNNQLIVNGQAYQNFSKLGGAAPSLLQQWKDFSSDARKLYGKANETGDSRIRESARTALKNAEQTFQKMEQLAASKPDLISELRIAKENTAKLYAIRAGTNEARNSFDAKVLGLMLEDGAGFTGKLRQLALIAQGMPDVVRDPYNSTFKFRINNVLRTGATIGLAGSAGGLIGGGVGSAIAGSSSLAIPFLGKRIGASPLVQNRSFLNPSSQQGTPDFLARVARFGTQGVFDEMTQQPQPANYSTF